MNSVEISSDAQKQVKALKKKYQSISTDLSRLISDLILTPTQADYLGNGLYKRRFAISAKGKGKSAGGRAIYILYHTSEDLKIVIVEVFDKSEKENITVKRMEQLKKEI